MLSLAVLPWQKMGQWRGSELLVPWLPAGAHALYLSLLILSNLRLL